MVFKDLLNPQTVAIILILIALSYTMFIKPYLIKNKLLTKEQLELIDYSCDQGVKYAEQIFKNDPTVNRNTLALDMAFEIIQKAGLIPEQYFDVVKKIIEAKVFELPKTH